MSKSYQHKVGQHFDIIMIIQTIFDMFQKLEDVNAIKTRVEKCIHALKCCLQHASQNAFNIQQCYYTATHPLRRLFPRRATIFTECGKRSFSYLAPTVWNKLPLNIRLSPTFDTFKRHLKTHLFK